MIKLTSSRIHRRISLWRWQAPVLALLLVLIHQLVEHIWLIGLSRWQHFATQVTVYGVVGPTLTWWALTTLKHSVKEVDVAQQALTEAHEQLTKFNEQLTCLLRLNRRLAEADDEQELHQIIIETPLEVVPALGCSFFRFDDRHKPLPAIHYGNLDPSVFENWAARLADAHFCQQCYCYTNDSDPQSILLCPVARKNSKASDVLQAYCIQITRGSHAYGTLNIYLQCGQTLTEREKSLLEALTHEMSLALESHILRTRELEMLSRLQRATPLHSLNDNLATLLKHTVEVLEIDGGVLFVSHVQTGKLQLLAKSDDLTDDMIEAIQNQFVNLDQANLPHFMSSLNEIIDQKRSVHVEPLRANNHSIGVLVMWARQPNIFTRRRTRLIEIVAGQAALLIANYRLYLQSEHRAALAERTRLAQEIHDGLAQTLGYLKLRAAQIQGWLESGDSQRSATGLTEIRQLLNDAYVDAREAIDGLHLKSNVTDFTGWVQEIISEFETLSGITVNMTSLPQVTLSLKANTQLQRIVQEMLSNIRKHARATRIDVGWEVGEDSLMLQISDDGCGFDPDSIPPTARHGLEIMRERAYLLSADLQIISKIGEGTQMTLQMPLEQIQGDIIRE